MNLSRLSIKYLLSDLAGSAMAWTLFHLIIFGFEWPWQEASRFSVNFYLTGVILVPAGWTAVYALTGFYHVSLKRSRLTELYYSLSVTIPGVIVCYLILLFNGIITEASGYFRSLIILFTLQFFITYIPRVLITSSTARKVHRGILGYNTLVIGSGARALEILKKLREEKISSGNIIRGYICTDSRESSLLGDHLQCLGGLDDLQKAIDDNHIEEVIIAIESDEHDLIADITGRLEYRDITIKAIPYLKDLLTGRVEQRSIFGTPLLEIPNKTMPIWQANIKEIMDYVLAVIALIVLSPLILILSVIIKAYDQGPVIYRQTRTGKNGRSFVMYKFRSMVPDAETNGPKLSGRDDPRITPVGRFMRKHRLDEIPNLINVLKGDMSLVGPRPERDHFISQIVKRAPHYRRLHRVKPGITSWGQVKYGYASSVDEMIERLEYDLLYIENMSLSIDLKILIYTTLIILKGKGI